VDELTDAELRLEMQQTADEINHTRTTPGGRLSSRAIAQARERRTIARDEPAHRYPESF
jgi:hypothetical protein